MPAPGMISRSCRVNSKEGTMPISAAPEAHWAAQSEGSRRAIVWRTGTIRGKPEFQIEAVALGPMEHAPDQGRGIQITDRRYARPMRGKVAQTPVYQTVCRVKV